MLQDQWSPKGILDGVAGVITATGTRNKAVTELNNALSVNLSTNQTATSSAKCQQTNLPKQVVKRLNVQDVPIQIHKHIVMSNGW